MKNRQSSFVLPVVTYVSGVLIGLTLAVIATWADVEAAFYGFDRRASTPLQGLRCPILMSRKEAGIVSVKMTNTTDRNLSPSVRAEFSTAFTPLSMLDSIELAPGESKTVTWTIGPDNIDLKRFIFSKVLVFASYPLPDREATCGTFVVNLPIRGSILLSILILLSAAGMGGGLFILNRLRSPFRNIDKALNPLKFLTVILSLALAVSLAGWWVQAILLLAVTLITIVIVVNHALLRQDAVPE